jgi:class 3 adenylate cyclase
MGPAELTLGDASLITATFLFTDIEGSTNLWETESQAMRIALQRHNTLLSAAIERHHGYVFKTVGDAFCVTFDDAAEALRAACQIQASLAAARLADEVRAAGTHRAAHRPGVSERRRLLRNDGQPLRPRAGRNAWRTDAAHFADRSPGA